VSSKAVAAPERTLILCVDRDDDLGVKAGVKTPILGREENINAAVTLALRDPEEPDANAIFEAVKIYDRLRESADGEESHADCQIATIAGSELGDVGADKELVSELNEVLKEYPASEVVLVTDGFADETILPLVQSRVPVTSVRRVTIRHSESIEETVWLFSRYVKILCLVACWQLRS
jgi:putative membrane protein